MVAVIMVLRSIGGGAVWGATERFLTSTTPNMWLIESLYMIATIAPAVS
jgi:hypothetical protein